MRRRPPGGGRGPRGRARVCACVGLLAGASALRSPPQVPGGLAAGGVAASLAQEAPAPGLPEAARHALPGELVLQVLDFVAWPAQVASSSGRSHAVLWDPSSGQPARIFSSAGQVADIRFSPCGEWIAVASQQGAVAVWSTVSGQLLRLLQGPSPIFEVQIFPDGERVAAVSADGFASVWHTASGAVLRMEQVGEPGAHRVVRVLPDAGRIVTGAAARGGGSAIVWNATTGERLQVFPTRQNGVQFLELRPRTDEVLTFGGVVGRLHSASSGDLAQAFLHSGGEVQGATFAESGRKVVAVSAQHVSLWDLAGGGRVGWRTRGLISGLAASPWSAAIVIFGPRHASVWSAASGALLRELPFLDDVEGVAMSPSGDTVAACSGRSALPGRPTPWDVTTVWHTPSGRLLHESRDIYHMATPGSPSSPCSIAMGAERSPCPRPAARGAPLLAGASAG